ncbi:hippocampus abundant transcript 1 protein isoform X2 [Frankliniella occidentalis]|uniref:Hippocampus abundant transcript 1 protein isoform X2 n=1 Tax=Frankliniella occidentalis TaxID=133901 RepID=A0A6J1S0C3_FRAOC|nr:hippocampus abundant transcript 1 protein isoform X2 [Frankliniella occidentalis]
MTNVELNTISLEVASSRPLHHEAKPNEFFSLPIQATTHHETNQTAAADLPKNGNSISPRKRSNSFTVCSIRAGVQLGVTEGLPYSSCEGSAHPSNQPIPISANPVKTQENVPRNSIFRQIWKHLKTSGIGEPSVYHALVVIFLEFFAWGLLTMPVISVLKETFPEHTFLMNGLIMGIKGILSFLSAPLIGALSDVWGRKFFLLVTVFFTCAPIPLMSINHWWFFAMISISGVFAVTFSVVFAYVADVTEENERSLAYGLVSATFAASLVISPALGAYMMNAYSENLVVAVATAIALLDVFIILVAVPESLPEKVRPSSWGAPISWEQADPFAALRKVGKDHTILMLCTTVFLSYLPEAGQYSCIFVYLKLVMDFNEVMVAVFIATIGLLSVGAQMILGILMKQFGSKHTIMVGLLFEMLQLMWFGFGSQMWMMWAAGVLASVSSITYPAISAFVSMHSDADNQGLAQGMVTGMRGLCNGLGPAMFGVIFYLFHVDLNDDGKARDDSRSTHIIDNATTGHADSFPQLIPGPPFVFGALLVICALLVAAFIPEGAGVTNNFRSGSRRQSGLSMEVHYEVERSKKHDGLSPLSPLVDDSAIL